MTDEQGQLSQLHRDLASFNNAPIEEVARTIASSLRGERAFLHHLYFFSASWHRTHNLTHNILPKPEN